ncbi:MAG: alpha/beta hydrolase [Pirellulaceae bacterium]|nr:alpha/beta hydrolase [Pirellulaceae bacterium]
MTHPIRKLVYVLIAAYLGMFAYTCYTQDERIFKPVSVELSKAARPKDFHEPPDLGLEDREILTEPSAVPMNALWLHASDQAPVALYLHGQEVTRHNNLHHARCLNELGCNVLVIDYRGYGETFGKKKPTEESVCHDAEVAWNYLTGTLKIPPERILIYGHSLGGAIAIDLASRHPEAGGLVAESTFTCIKDVARSRNCLTYLLPLDFMIRHRFDSLEKVRENRLPPAFFIHGKDDLKVPSYMCSILHGAAQGPDKHILLRDGEHADRKGGQIEYEAKMKEFLSHYFGP